MAWQGTPITDTTPAGRTLATMRAEVRANVGDERTDLNDIIDQYLDTAQLELARERNWKDLEVRDTTSISTTASVAYVTPPADMLKLLHLVVTDGSMAYPLKEYTSFQFRTLWPYPEIEATGMPQVCAFIDEKLYFAPMPDAAYALHIHYKKRPTALSDDADLVEIDNCEEYLVARAAERIFLRLGMFDDARAWEATASKLREALSGQDREVTVPLMDGWGRGYGRPSSSGMDIRSPWYRP